MCQSGELKPPFSPLLSQLQHLECAPSDHLHCQCKVELIRWYGRHIYWSRNIMCCPPFPAPPHTREPTLTSSGQGSLIEDATQIATAYESQHMTLQLSFLCLSDVEDECPGGQNHTPRRTVSLGGEFGRWLTLESHLSLDSLWVGHKLCVMLLKWREGITQNNPVACDDLH